MVHVFAFICSKLRRAIMKLFLLLWLAFGIALIGSLVSPPFAAFVGMFLSGSFAAILTFICLLCVQTLVTLVSLLMPHWYVRIETYVTLAIVGYASFCAVMVSHDENGAVGAVGAAVGVGGYCWGLYRFGVSEFSKHLESKVTRQ
jgi:hypothetical protein